MNEQRLDRFDEPLSDAILQRFVQGELIGSELTGVLEHLAVSEEALARVDALWANRPVGTAISLEETTETPVPERAEKRLFNHIHRTDLVGHITRLGTVGFFEVILSFLRPLFATRGANHSHEGETND